MKNFIVLLCFFIFTSLSLADDNFSFEFEWGDIKKCTSGNPNRVDNPIFKLSSVPEGTVLLKFRMTDKNATSYNHGGGKAEYTGNNIIEPGAFKYKSPCPPSGKHTYEWRIIAYDKDKNKLGIIKATRKYPE